MIAGSVAVEHKVHFRTWSLDENILRGMDIRSYEKNKLETLKVSSLGLAQAGNMTF